MWLEIKGTIMAIKFIRMVAANFGEVSLGLKECKTVVEAFRFHEYGANAPYGTLYNPYDLTILARVMCGVHKYPTYSEHMFLKLVNGQGVSKNMLAALNRWYWETFMMDAGA